MVTPNGMHKAEIQRVWQAAKGRADPADVSDENPTVICLKLWSPGLNKSNKLRIIRLNFQLEGAPPQYGPYAVTKATVY